MELPKVHVMGEALSSKGREPKAKTLMALGAACLCCLVLLESNVVGANSNVLVLHSPALSNIYQPKPIYKMAGQRGLALSTSMGGGWTDVHAPFESSLPQVHLSNNAHIGSKSAMPEGKDAPPLSNTAWLNSDFMEDVRAGKVSSVEVLQPQTTIRVHLLDGTSATVELGATSLSTLEDYLIQNDVTIYATPTEVPKAPWSPTSFVLLGLSICSMLAGVVTHLRGGRSEEAVRLVGGTPSRVATSGDLEAPQPYGQRPNQLVYAFSQSADGEASQSQAVKTMARVYNKRTTFVAETMLPTTHGTYRVRSYKHSLDGITYTDPIAIISGNPEGKSDVALRVHDACWTSEVLGSLKCDCAQQLQQALDYMRENGDGGVVIYLHQEGRGIGLANKIAAYKMQESGMDTVEANRVLGLPDDSREYTAVKDICEDLDIKSLQLMTNNPRKVRELQGLGVTVAARLSCITEVGELAMDYLNTKKEQMGHNLTDEPDVDVLCVFSPDQRKSTERFGTLGAHGDDGF